MLYLSGVVRAELLDAPGLGLVLTPNMGNRPDLSRTTWAADNGCFSQGAAFKVGRYITWLEERMSEHRDTCLFATAPDVVGDAEATWARSAPVLPLLRWLGYKAAYVAQDGMELLAVEWDAFDALFIGGSTEWKLSSAAFGLIQEAKARGKWVHMGRVNSRRRFVAAASMGCDSVDGTFLAFGPDKNLPRLQSWIREIERQSLLPLAV
jgi:hypothetical protein